MSDNPFLNRHAATGPFKPALRLSAKAKCFLAVDPTQAGAPPAETAVPVGTRLIWDTLVMRYGWARLQKGRYAEITAPSDAPEPPKPPSSDEKEWQPVTTSQAWLDTFPDHPAALRKLSIVGKMALGELAALFHMLSFRKEIQAGQLAVLEIHPFRDVSTPNGVFGVPVLEAVGFVDRNETVFGPALVAPPSPVLAAPVTPLQVAASIEAAVPPESKPAVNPLAAFRPLGGGRQPY